MPPRRKVASTVSLLTVTLALLLASALAWACAPAAPVVQDSAPAAEAEPTATPTLTPRPESDVTDNLGYVALAVYRLAEQQNQGAACASGSASGPRLPERIYVHITAWTSLVDDLERMLRDSGATDINVIKDVDVSIVESQAPPTLLPDITRHPAFVDVFTHGIYPNMEQGLDDALTMYAGGVFTATETARMILDHMYFPEYPENIIVKIELDTPTRYASVRDFLAARDAFPHDIEPGASWFYAGVPVPIMDELYSYKGVVYIDEYPLYYPDVEPSSAAPAVQDGAPETPPPPGVTAEPMLRNIAAVGSQNNVQGASGASGLTNRTVKLDVMVDSSETMDYEEAYISIRNFIVNSGGSAASGVGEYHVPIAIVSELLQRPEVISILMIDEGDFPYPKMDRGLNNVVSALQSGSEDGDAVKYACIRHANKAYLILEAADNQSLANAKNWLVSNEVYINPKAYSPADPPGTTERNFPTPYLTVLVPVSLIQPLSELPGIVDLAGGDCWHWDVDVAELSPELLAYFALFTTDLLPPHLRPTPAPDLQPSENAAPDVGGKSGASAPSNCPND